MATESIISGAAGLGVGSSSKIANVMNGTQLGVGYNAANFDAATPQIFAPMYFVVMSTPTCFSKYEVFGQYAKGLIEGCVKTASGFDFGYSMDVAKTTAGQDSQESGTPLRTKRSGVTPQLVIPELSGNCVYNFFRNWMFACNDPDTGAAFVGLDYDGQFISSAYSMTVLGIQFSPTMRSDDLIDGALYTNMFPTDIGQIGFERQVGTSKMLDRSISFDGTIVRHNDTTKELAIQVAKKLMLNKVNYRKAAVGVTQINSALSGYGLEYDVAQSSKVS